LDRGRLLADISGKLRTAGQTRGLGDQITVKKNLWPVILANLSLAKGSHAAVGFPSEKDKPHAGAGDLGAHMTNAQVATANEIGSAPGVFPKVPARPFMKQTMDHTKPKFQGAMRDLVKMIFAGQMSTKIALERIGNLGASEVKWSFTVEKFAPNAAYTIARKGSSRPLIDTGALRQGVTWIVRMKSGAKK
jgi:hypothetical protein